MTDLVQKGLETDPFENPEAVEQIRSNFRSLQYIHGAGVGISLSLYTLRPDALPDTVASVLVSSAFFFIVGLWWAFWGQNALLDHLMSRREATVKKLFNYYHSSSAILLAAIGLPFFVAVASIWL